MVKGLGVILILLMTFSTIIPFSLLSFHKASVEKMIRKGLKEQIPDSELITFSEIDLKDAEWIHDKEFRLGGEMYDVVRIKVKNNTTKFLCFKDSREDKIWKWLHNASEKDSNDTGKIFQLNITLFCEFNFTESFLPNLRRISAHFRTNYFLLQRELESPYTPPKPHQLGFNGCLA